MSRELLVQATWREVYHSSLIFSLLLVELCLSNRYWHQMYVGVDQSQFLRCPSGFCKV